MKELTKLALTTTSPVFENSTVRLLETIFHNISYPRAISNSIITEQMQQVINKAENNTSKSSKHSEYVACPYYRLVTNRIGNILHDNKSFIRLGHKPIITNKSQVFSKLKWKKYDSCKIRSRFTVHCFHCNFQSTLYADQLNIKRTISHHENSDHSEIKKHLSEFPFHGIDHEPKSVKAFSSISNLRVARSIGNALN